MSTPNADAGAISFAHLAGITSPVLAAKKADTDDKKEDAKKAEDDSDDEKAESDETKEDAKAEDDSDDAKAEDEKPADEDEKKDAKKAAVSGVSEAVAAERGRWATVLGSKAFARNAVVGARLLASTDMSAAAIMDVLRDVPAASNGSDARSARNPNLGVSAAAPAPSIKDSWMAAAKRAGIKV